jgi:hypothetical protein
MVIWCAKRKGRRLKMAANFFALYSSNWSASSRAASAMYPEYCVTMLGWETACSHESPFPAPLEAWQATLYLYLPNELESVTLKEGLVHNPRRRESARYSSANSPPMTWLASLPPWRANVRNLKNPRMLKTTLIREKPRVHELWTHMQAPLTTKPSTSPAAQKHACELGVCNFLNPTLVQIISCKYLI